MFSVVVLVAVALLVGPSGSDAADLTVDGTIRTLGGTQTYDTVIVRNGGEIVVPQYDGSDPVNTGNLELTCQTLLVTGAYSKISARGKGFQTARCDHGKTYAQNEVAAGGCMVRDSGGGGGHGGRGGQGTTDCAGRDPNTGAVVCTFPLNYEERCSDSLSGTSCSTTSNCRNGDGLDRTEGADWTHNVFDNTGGAGFGGSGGDKGCRDGDGFGSQLAVGGSGGGRIYINCASVTVEDGGQLNAEGERGCSQGNDSGGAGAGGTIIVTAQNITATGVPGFPVISVNGGQGGDSQAKNVGTRNAPQYVPECLGTQLSGTCDDCGGGGGGGYIYLSAENSNLFANRTQLVAPNNAAVRDLVASAGGGLGGVCPACETETTGVRGQVYLEDAAGGKKTYNEQQTEYCNGIDDNQDGVVDMVRNRDGTTSPLKKPCGTGPNLVYIDRCRLTSPFGENDCPVVTTGTTGAAPTGSPSGSASGSPSGSPSGTPTTGVPFNGCGDFQDCASCAAHPSCGWCDASSVQACLPNPGALSSTSFQVCQGLGGDFSPLQCNNPSTNDDCPASNCSDCLQVSGCAWCDGANFNGCVSSAGALQTKCTAEQGLWFAQFCPAPPSQTTGTTGNPPSTSTTSSASSASSTSTGTNTGTTGDPEAVVDAAPGCFGGGASEGLISACFAMMVAGVI